MNLLGAFILFLLVLPVDRQTLPPDQVVLYWAAQPGTCYTLHYGAARGSLTNVLSLGATNACRLTLQGGHTNYFRLTTQPGCAGAPTLPSGFAVRERPARPNSVLRK